MAKVHHTFITGETSLVEEYCLLCAGKRMPVTVRLLPGNKSRLPKEVSRSSAVPKSTTLALELTNTSPDVKKKNLALLDRSLPSSIPIISSSVTITVAEQTGWVKHPERLIGIGALPSLLEGSLIEFAASSLTNEQTKTIAYSFASSLGKEAATVRDSVGLVMPRILCMLTNEAYFAMMEGVANGSDIDTAMKLGTNYPLGPVERGQRIGLVHVHAVLSALWKQFGEDRYRIAPMLQQAVFMSR